MAKKSTRFQFGISGLLIVMVIAAGLFAFIEYMKPNYKQHFQKARQLVGSENFTHTSSECNKRMHCADGTGFYLYFYSTNGRASSRSYMVTVITISKAGKTEQYFKLEPFHYSRSRAISDSHIVYPLSGSNWANKLPLVEQQELQLIYNASDLDELRAGLENFEWERVN